MKTSTKIFAGIATAVAGITVAAIAALSGKKTDTDQVAELADSTEVVEGEYSESTEVED